MTDYRAIGFDLCHVVRAALCQRDAARQREADERDRARRTEMVMIRMDAALEQLMTRDEYSAFWSDVYRQIGGRTQIVVEKCSTGIEEIIHDV